MIAIIGTLVALLLPAVQSARETARGNTCRNNMKQLNLAMLSLDTQQQKLPGYVNALVNPHDRTQGRRASWVIMTFPYMELTSLWDSWSGDFTNSPDKSWMPAIEGLTCPSDPPESPAEPWLNYVANSGRGFSDGATDKVEYAGNGVFFDNSKNTAILASSQVDGREDPTTDPPIQMSISYIQSNDGTSKTLMLSESLHAWFYVYDGDESTPEICEPGISADKDTSPIRDTKHIFGFIWKNDAQGIERINGDKYFDKGTDPPASMAKYAAVGSGYPSLYESYGYPTSAHPGGANFAFCDGHLQSLAESIEPRVYAQLMTSNRNRSKLVWGGVSDRKLAQPSDSEY